VKEFFSKRHEQALTKGTLKITIPLACRVSIDRILSQYSDWAVEDNLTYLSAEAKLKTFYGANDLRAYDENGKLVPAELSQVIQKSYPSAVLDVIEAWFDDSPLRSRDCEKELNDIFMIHNSPWRVVNGRMVLVDSEYLHREVRVKTVRLLEECEIQGALEEFKDAISDLTSGDTKNAIINAHKSVESAMKAVLGTNEGHTFGKLLEMLIKSGIIPEYYDEFLAHFERIALGVVKERNLPARGHGQGKRPTVVSRNLAEFAVNLAGSIIVFIIRQWIEVRLALEEPEELPF
jgi:HEPN domain-containing protein